MTTDQLTELERHAAYCRRQWEAVANHYYSIDPAMREIERKARNTMNRASYAYRQAYQEAENVRLHLERMIEADEQDEYRDRAEWAYPNFM